MGGTYVLKELGGVSITFVGVFSSKNDVYNDKIVAGRRYLQELDEKLGQANQVYIKIVDARHTNAVKEAVDTQIPKKFPYATETTDQRSFLTGAVRDLMDMVKFARIILLISLAVILIAVANTISMATRDRIHEIGMLRSLGFRRIHIGAMILGESTLLSLLGGALGLIVTTAIMVIQKPVYGTRGLDLEFHVPLSAMFIALGLSLAIGLVGGLVPAISAGRVNIVTALRRID